MSDVLKESIQNGVEKLKKYLKFDDDYKTRLILAVLVNNKFLNNAKPIVFLKGSHDSGKTTRGTFLVAIMNDNIKYGLNEERRTSRNPITHKDEQLVDVEALVNAPLLAPSTAEEYLLVAQNYNSVLFDNIDQTDNRLYSTICMLATGGKIGKRKLWTDNELISSGKLITVVYTGIKIVMDRDDVRSRHVVINVPPFKDDKEDEDVLRESFLQDLPAIRATIDGLYNYVKACLPNYRTIKIGDKYRLRMFARIGCIINLYLDQTDFLLDYDKALDVINEIQTSDDVGDMILAFFKNELDNSGKNYLSYSTTKLQQELVRSNPEIASLISSPGSLGMLLTSHKDIFEVNGFVLKKKKTMDGSYWSIGRKFSGTHEVNWDEEEENPTLENPNLLK
jgi:hypothetical protein